MKISEINENGLLIVFGDDISIENHEKVTYYFNVLKTYEHLTTIIPSYNCLQIHYDVKFIEVEEIIKKLKNITFKREKSKLRIVTIPVLYDGVDLEDVAKIHNLSIGEIIELHSNKTYLVYMLGFTLGFPYLGGLDQRLYTSRLESPRLKVPKGSVGIGGKQTGIYPVESPGGWRLIGRTPVELFDLSNEKTLLRIGDQLKFESINQNKYHEILLCQKQGNYEIEVSYVDV